MAIITISREIMALGEETAAELVKLLNYRLIDKSTIEERIVSYGFTERKMEKYDERKPGFWASLSQDRYDYLEYLKTAMYEEAQKGDCIFVGRGASSIFHNIPGLVSVLIVSPTPIRIERAKINFCCNEKSARQLIDRSDCERAGFHRDFFDIDWAWAANYMLVLNTGLMHPETAAAIIVELKKLTITVEDELKCKDKLVDLRLGQKVVNHILYEKRLHINSLEATCTAGDILLSGITRSPTSADAAIEAAKNVVGVKTARGTISVVPQSEPSFY